MFRLGCEERRMSARPITRNDHPFTYLTIHERQNLLERVTARDLEADLSSVGISSWFNSNVRDSFKELPREYQAHLNDGRNVAIGLSGLSNG